MDEINQVLFPLWNLSPQAPGWLVGLARWVSGVLTNVAVLAVFATLARPGPWRRLGWQMLLALALAWLVARGIHTAWPQPRPFMLGQGQQWIMHSPSASFPSRHATIGMAFGLTGLLAAPRRWVGVLCLLAGLLIGWSRVALGVHFPLDVLAGWAIAGVVALAVHLVWRHWVVPAPLPTICAGRPSRHR